MLSFCDTWVSCRRIDYSYLSRRVRDTVGQAASPDPKAAGSTPAAPSSSSPLLILTEPQYPSGMSSTRKPRDIVVRCSSGKHAVRLARGRRLLRRAACPVCRAPVDPNRLRRLLAWAIDLGRPASGWWGHRLLSWASLGCFALAALALGLLWGLSDLWWPATILLFGPRWVLLLPIVLLLPAAWIWDRAMLPVLCVSGLVLLGPVMDFRFGWRSLLPEEGEGAELRVLSLNAAGGMGLTPAVGALLSDPELDLLAIQECGNLLRGDPELLPDWHIDRRSGVCLLSRFEILEVAEMEREVLESAGGSGVAVTYTLDVGGTPVYLTNVHLETPRAGFELFRSGRLREGIPKIQEKSFLRGVEIRKARAWADAFSGPHLVAGDFNTPPESRLYREAWQDWQNAFSLSGWGFGGTRLNGWIRVRIDHILASPEWRVGGAWLGEDVGSDHLPIGADLKLR